VTVLGRSGRASDRVESALAKDQVRLSAEHDKAPETPTSRGAPARTSGRGARRVTPRRLERIHADLSDREQTILVDLDRFRFLTSGQIQILHFRGHATEEAAARIRRRVLARLASYRVVEYLDRRVGGIRAGSASYVWRVGVVGDRLLRMQRGEGGTSRRKEPSARYLDHCLAIASCYTELVQMARLGQLDLVATETEPTSWRRFLGTGGSPEILKPDLYVVTASGEFEDHWFVEGRSRH
jgi:Replication-relaxation